MRILISIISAGLAAMLLAPANAATATYIMPADIPAADEAALSTAGDDAGYILGLNETLAIILDNPVGATAGGNVTIFTLAPDSGNARVTVRIGSYNNGNPQFVISRRIRAGNSRAFNNLFRRGCSLFGGCDYIEITTTRARNGATGVEIDYIEVDGELVEVTSPTPEPATWALMIIGFGATAMRLKALRRRNFHPPPFGAISA